MNVKQFISKELSSLASQLPGATLRYKCDQNNAHVVEVSPKSVYSSDKFMALGIEADDRICAQFPEAWLVFIPNGSYVGIDDIAGEELVFRSASKAQRPAPARRKPKAQAMEYA
ncbi:MAG: hypothetical protein LBK18_05505 [Prevotellaceae bacterium]|jgi:hypothetical protein|nr:hypothetical protein [Prevotellaceae bacterium]